MEASKCPKCGNMIVCDYQGTFNEQVRCMTCTFHAFKTKGITETAEGNRNGYIGGWPWIKEVRLDHRQK